MDPKKRKHPEPDIGTNPGTVSGINCWGTITQIFPTLQNKQFLCSAYMNAGTTECKLELSPQGENMHLFKIYKTPGKNEYFIEKLSDEGLIRIDGAAIERGKPFPLKDSHSVEIEDQFFSTRTPPTAKLVRYRVNINSANGAQEESKGEPRREIAKPPELIARRCGWCKGVLIPSGTEQVFCLSCYTKIIKTLVVCLFGASSVAAGFGNKETQEETKIPGYEKDLELATALQNLEYREAFPFFEGLMGGKRSPITHEKKSSPIPPKNPDVQCDICQLVVASADQLPISVCGHIFHRGCLNHYFTVEIKENKMPLICPKEKCRIPLPSVDIENFIEGKDLDRYWELEIQAFANRNPTSYSCCPTASCNYVFAYIRGEDSSRLNCPKCLRSYCLDCRVPFHADQTCAQYQSTRDASIENEFIKFAQGMNYKQCEKCKFWVEKTAGCRHMTCRCKYEFCYLCGGPYPKCKCPAKA